MTLRTMIIVGSVRTSESGCFITVTTYNANKNEFWVTIVNYIQTFYNIYLNNNLNSFISYFNYYQYKYFKLIALVWISTLEIAVAD